MAETTKSQGLGDTIEKITIATGIRRVVKYVAQVAKKDCGCAEKKKMLNELIPYKQDNHANTETTSK